MAHSNVTRTSWSKNRRYSFAVRCSKLRDHIGRTRKAQATQPLTLADPPNSLNSRDVWTQSGKMLLLPPFLPANTLLIHRIPSNKVVSRLSQLLGLRFENESTNTGIMNRSLPLCESVFSSTQRSLLDEESDHFLKTVSRSICFRKLSNDLDEVHRVNVILSTYTLRSRLFCLSWYRDASVIRTNSLETSFEVVMQVVCRITNARISNLNLGFSSVDYMLLLHLRAAVPACSWLSIICPAIWADKCGGVMSSSLAVGLEG